MNRRAASVAAMSERELQAHVARICADLGALHYHTHSSLRSEPGFPDSVIVGAHGVLWRELKTARGAVTGAQARWIEHLTLAGQDVAVWRPEDLTSGAIAVQVAAITLGKRAGGAR